MKKALIILIPFLLLVSIGFMAYNTDQGPYKSKEGITELPVPIQDSLIERGKNLVNKMSREDREAIAAFYNK